MQTFGKTGIILLTFIILTGCHRNDQPVKALILSGRNNHDWKKTTPVLEKALTGSGLFSVSVTEKPDTLKLSDLKRFDILVSNWNSFPDNEMRFSTQWENDFLRFIKEGGGALFIHAGSSSFYSWEQYHQAGIGRWGSDTHHGEPTTGLVYGFDESHPITKGLKDFKIEDELWEKTDIYPGATVLARVSGKDTKDGHLIDEPVIFVNQIEKGRTFFTALGHDEKTLENEWLKVIILRAAQWTARRKVK